MTSAAIELGAAAVRGGAQPAPVGFGAKAARLLRAVERRSRWLTIYRALGRGAAVALGGALVACAIDRIFRLTAETRAILLTADVALTAALTIVPTMRAVRRRRSDWIELAAAVERRHPT